MNKHTKIAILIAPILSILGFAATDMYKEYKAGEKQLYILSADDGCDIKAGKCVLKSQEFLISVTDNNGQTTINSTFPIDTATLFLVDQKDQMTSFPLGMKDNPYYWRATTGLSERLKKQGTAQKLRLVANIKGGAYISEFTSITQ